MRLWCGLEFLAVSGRGWDEATAGDVEAFKVWRLTDLRNEGRVMPHEFRHRSGRAEQFLLVGIAPFRGRNPVRTVAGTPRRLASARCEPWMQDRGSRGFGARDGLRPAGSARRQVKWMLRPAFEQWRNIGLRGYGFGWTALAGLAWWRLRRSPTWHLLMASTAPAYG